MQEERWETSPLHPSLRSALNQPYRYLGSGGQAYAFVSEDQRYVIKFLKQHHMRESRLLSHLPFSGKWQTVRRERRETILSSFKIAHDHFKEGTGLLYLHLNPTDQLPPFLTFYDPIGIRHKIDLNRFAFALQEKADPAYETIEKLLREGEVGQAKVLIASLVELVANRYRAKVVDNDPRKRNFGFVGNRAIEIDLGSFSLSQGDPKKRTFFYETSKMRSWVKKHAPELLETVQQEINRNLLKNSSIPYNRQKPLEVF